MHFQTAVLICRISLNGLKRYIDSNEAFDAAKNAGSKDKTMDIWISKNNHALKQCTQIRPNMALIIVSEEEQTTSNVDIIPNTLPYPDERMSLDRVFPNGKRNRTNERPPLSVLQPTK